MSKVTQNHLVKGARGKFSDQFVYRQRGGETIMTRLPRLSPDRVATEKQEKSRDLFASGAAYAKSAMANPELKAEYSRKATGAKTSFNIAFRDFLKAPVVKELDLSAYNGAAGSLITVKAKDDFRVAAVWVRIQDQSGNLVEEGSALLHPINRSKWTYTAAQSIGSLTGTVVTAIATDLPGNEGAMSRTL